MHPLSRLLSVLLTAFFLLIPALPQCLANDPVLLNDYALELLKKNEYEKALEQLQKAYGMFPYNLTLKRNLAEAYTYVGKRQMDRNAYEEAAASFDYARELFPEEGKYGVMRGIALYLMKNYDGAAFELERARNNGAETAENLYFMGRIAYDTGNLPGALELLEKALVLDPSSRLIMEQLEKVRRESKVEGGMDRGYSSRFTVSYDAGGTKSELADTILSTLEEAYNRVGSDLSHFPTARIPVILYTRKDYRVVTTSPEWSGGLYDGKIRLPIGGATELTSSLQGVLFHEYTHVVINELAAGRCPTWLNEGLAEVEERKVHESPLSQLQKAAKWKGLIPITHLEGSFSGLGTTQALLAYEESYSLVSYMISTYGWYKVRDLLINLGAGMGIGQAMAVTLKDFGLDYLKVIEEWQGSIAKNYGQ